MRLAIIIAWRCTTALVLAAAFGAPAGAVVIATGSDGPNLVAPGNDPGWLNVGRIAGASGVYLGDRWVITANHVSSGALRLSDGREFAVSVGSDVRLSNPGNSFGRPDLRMFRLAADPGLPSLEIAAAVPEIGSQLIMIGAGVDRAPRLLGWQTGLVWNEVPLPFAGALGYSLASSSHMRWGVNLVGSGSSFGTDQTYEFITRFDQQGIPFEAQAVLGDSGGGAFHFHDGAWELAGIMTSTRLLPGQPNGTVVYGDQTFVADLSVYSGQILDFINLDEPLWQNQVNHYDVSRSGRVEARDLLLLANELTSAGSHELEGAPGAPDFLYDVNGDYRVTASDAQQLVNGLLSGTVNPASASASGAGTNFVPEPSGAVLAACGLLFLVVAQAVARRRRLANPPRQRSRVSLRIT